MTTERHAELGVLTISEGNEAVFGVWRGGRTGLVTAGILTSTTRESVLEAFFEVETDGRRRELVEDA